MRFKFFFSISSFSCFSSSSCSWSSWTCWTKPPLPSKHFWFIDTFQVLLGTPSTVTMVRYNHYLNRVLTLRRHNSRYRRSVNHRLPCVSFTLTEPTFGFDALVRDENAVPLCVDWWLDLSSETCHCGFHPRDSSSFQGFHFFFRARQLLLQVYDVVFHLLQSFNLSFQRRQSPHNEFHILHQYPIVNVGGWE